MFGKPPLARSHSALGHIESTAFHGMGSSGSSLEFHGDSSMVLSSNSDSENGSRSTNEIISGMSMTTGSVFSPLVSKSNRQTDTGLVCTENKIESVPILSIPALHMSAEYSPLRDNENNSSSHLSFAPVPYLQVRSSFNNSFSNPTIDETRISSVTAATSGLTAFSHGGQFQRVIRSSPHFSAFDNPNSLGLTQPLSLSPYASNNHCVGGDDLATGDDTVSIARRQLHDVLRCKAASPWVHLQNFQDGVDLGSDSLESSPSRCTFGTDNGIPNFRGRLGGYQTRGRNNVRRDGQNEHIMPHLNDENEHNMSINQNLSINRSLTVNNSFCLSDLKIENQKEKKIRDKKRIKKSEAKIRRMSLAPSSRISKIKNKIIFDSPILDLTENKTNEGKHKSTIFDLCSNNGDNDISTDISEERDSNRNSNKNSNFSSYRSSRRSSGILNILIDDLTDRFNTATVLSPAATAKLSSNKKKIKNKKNNLFLASYDENEKKNNNDADITIIIIIVVIIIIQSNQFCVFGITFDSNFIFR